MLAAPPLHGAPLTGEPIVPVRAATHIDPARARLGDALFHDPRLSGNGRVSCASCHDLARGGADGRVRSPGLHGRPTRVNVPTVLNAALNFRQFWDGRAGSLEAQLDEVIVNPDEMGSSWEAVVRTVATDATYVRAFAWSYADGVTRANIRDAIATFERSLLTPGSRFDRYLDGDANAISALERAGYEKFKQFGCVACHQGVGVGGNMYQKLGVMTEYFDADRPGGDGDLGRFATTRRASDRHVFKVPGLRNVALTAPYFHDGSVPTLAGAVDAMFRFQLGRPASAADRDAIVAFLKTLTGVPVRRP